MRGVLTTALAALLAIFVFAAPKPASALPAQAAIDYSQANSASDLVEVKKRYKKKYKKRYKKGRYYRGPRYRGRYYGRNRYYGRGYYGRGYYGRRRGAVTIWW